MLNLLQKKSWKVSWVSILLMTLGLNTAVLAQEITVQGKIIDSENNAPLPGVSVVVKGTNRGTNTDADGKYRLSVASSATLVFSFVGYSAQEIAVGNRSTIDLKMAQDLKQLQ